MELNGSIVAFLENKSILVTGSTGFLGKVFVEKLLRVQPDLKHLFLILRAPDPTMAARRLHSEVLGKEVFNVLRTKCGVGFDTFISEKVTPVAGDTALKNFGLADDSDLLNKLLKDVDVVAHFAATTKCDERYDVALEVNTMGAKNVLEFAKKCTKVQTVVHVSTVLDIDEELKLAQIRLNELKVGQVSENEEKDAMQVFGTQRARLFGWPNTYTFTKAMGEMLIGKLGENAPIVIIRPTIVTSTYKEPFSGWSEGVRTIDRFIVAAARGKLPCFLGNIRTIFDLVPWDMVVNAMMVAMVRHANKSTSSGPFICHLCSSKTEPVNSTKLRDYVYDYFTKNPLIGRDGKPIKTIKPARLPSMASFRRHVFLSYKIPLKALQLVNVVSCHYLHDTCKNMKRKIDRTVRMVNSINLTYSSKESIFEDSNTERLRTTISANKVEENAFYCDPKCIDWNDYFMNIHFPGLVKYVIKL
ncbi:hypothetical protein MKW98_025993 [Papaver atlanticum]|uniref:Fatty acyl-CoA reductase n=1 Tax=Papaver atlanticum TaxID=357466 RepID=A0AAD4RXW0_9MAGN|nr:hypothetical protein MKW98_025993 [Papaver atlanticum]